MINIYNSNISSVNAISRPSLIGALQAVNRVSPVSGVSLNNRSANMHITPKGNRPVTYIMSQAPRQFIRSSRIKEINAYRSGLESSRSRDDVNAVSIFTLDSTLRDLKRSSAEESEFIVKHMEKLMKQRDKFMSGEDYQKLSWSAAVPGKDAAKSLSEADESAAKANTADDKKDTDVKNEKDTDYGRIEFGKYKTELDSMDKSREAQEPSPPVQQSAPQPTAQASAMNNMLAAMQLK